MARLQAAGEWVEREARVGGGDGDGGPVPPHVAPQGLPGRELRPADGALVYPRLAAATATVVKTPATQLQCKRLQWRFLLLKKPEHLFLLHERRLGLLVTRPVPSQRLERRESPVTSLALVGRRSYGSARSPTTVGFHLGLPLSQENQAVGQVLVLLGAQQVKGIAGGGGGIGVGDEMNIMMKEIRIGAAAAVATLGGGRMGREGEGEGRVGAETLGTLSLDDRRIIL